MTNNNVTLPGVQVDHRIADLAELSKALRNQMGIDPTLDLSTRLSQIEVEKNRQEVRGIQ